jgi:alpha-N-acetylglucosaminidase
MKYNILIACLFLFATGLMAQTQVASEQLIKRVIPKESSKFRVEIIPSRDSMDIFEIESKGDKIILRGNTGVSVASALNLYLKYFCHAQLSWNGDNINLPAELPTVKTKIRIKSPFKQRVYLNYCTFSYSMPWWNWTRWQREIDWMAMRGINMPLAVVGQESVWQNTLRKYKMTDDEIRTFLVGPAFQAWQWMTNIETYGGPLPQNWINSHLVLGKQILQRERELGMTPILQSFTGYVPVLLKRKFLEAKITMKNRWCKQFDATVQLDPLDPLFQKMGKTFLEEQEKLFGTNHIYAADPFHEGTPPSTEKSYLQAVGKIILSVAQSQDEKAIIAMQTWSLRADIAQTFPKDRLLLLDLMGGKAKKFSNFWGYPYVAGVLHNYGGRVYMGGRLSHYANNVFDLKADSAGAHLTGIGIFPEAIDQNPVVYDLATEIGWMNQRPELRNWVLQYAESRYGKCPASIEKGWDILLNTVYNKQSGLCPSIESFICSRPALAVKLAAPNGDAARPYNTLELWKADDAFLEASDELKNSDTYRFDLVDVTRQCLSDLSNLLQRDMAKAYNENSKERFETSSTRFLDLMDDFDRLLNTRSTFMLGKWISEARSWGKTAEEKDLYEWNARTQITVWGPRHPDALLFDYSNRQWAGLVKGYYKPRWEKYINYLKSQPQAEGRYSEASITKKSYSRPAIDANEFYKSLSDWEYQWANEKNSYSAKPSGDEILISKELYQKWFPVMTEFATIAKNVKATDENGAADISGSKEKK